MTEEELMLTTILNRSRAELYIDRPELTAAQLGQLHIMKERRQAQEPLQYILGSTEFVDVKLKVDSRVLIPRPETEILVEQVLFTMAREFHQTEFKVLDIGTGSGNIAISLAQKIAGLKVWAIDASADALEVARNNARLNHVAHQIDFAHIDVREFCKNYADAENRFDIIVSNPPYIKRADLAALPVDVRQEPRMALDGGEDGLDFYRTIIAHAKKFLKPDGILACEFGDGQEIELQALLNQNGFTRIEFINDYTQTPRIFVAHN